MAPRVRWARGEGHSSLDESARAPRQASYMRRRASAPPSRRGLGGQELARGLEPLALVAVHAARNGALRADLEHAAVREGDAQAARLALLEGQRHGLTSLGRREVDRPANRDTTVTTLSSANDAKVRELLTQIGQLFGDAKASAAQLALLQDRAAPLAQRREILLAFARDAYAAALPTALAALDEEPLRRDAIRALAAFDHNRVALSLLAR